MTRGGGGRSGRQADLARSRAYAGGKASASSPLRLAPLRRIVSREVDDLGLVYELLECGHHQRPRSDMIGETVVYRRRCQPCLEGRCDNEGHLIDEQPGGRIGCRCGRADSIVALMRRRPWWPMMRAEVKPFLAAAGLLGQPPAALAAYAEGRDEAARAAGRP